MILIGLCPRSGGAYITKVLQMLGKWVRHEALGPDGLVDWRIPGEGFIQGMSVQRLRGRAGVILHQVREPLHCIASMQTLGEGAWKYLCENSEVPKDDPVLTRCLKLWVEWNEEALHKAEWTYRVEDLADVFMEFCTRAEVTVDSSSFEVLDVVPKNENSRVGKYEPVTWDQLLGLDVEAAQKAQALARTFGYGMGV